MSESEIRKNIQDASLSVSAALPAAGATANTDALDLQGGTGKVELNVKVDANTTLVAAKSVTVKVQESDDGVSFKDAPWAGIQTITGKTGNGSDEFNQRIAIPTTGKRYIRLTATAAADAGNNTANSFSLIAMF